MDFTLSGILVVDKPQGMTSLTVIRRLKPQLATLAGVKPARLTVGHAGTLDPLATGVLAVCVGDATRLVEAIHDWPKIYRASFQFGVSSDTDDVTGAMQTCENSVNPTLAEIERVLPEYCGSIRQVPPAYSAVRLEGHRAYDLARRGEDFTLEPKLVTVHSVELECYSAHCLTVLIECGSGTYVRAWGRDLAAKLNTVCVMTSLVRTAAGPWTLSDAITLDECDRGLTLSQFYPLIDAVRHWPRFLVDSATHQRLIYGQRLLVDGSQFAVQSINRDRIRSPRFPTAGQPIAIVNTAGVLVGIAVLKATDERADSWVVQPRQLFSACTP